MQMIVYSCLPFPALSGAYVMLLKMYYSVSKLNSLTSQNIWFIIPFCDILGMIIASGRSRQEAAGERGIFSRPMRSTQIEQKPLTECL